MKHLIDELMIKEFNEILESENSLIRLQYDHDENYHRVYVRLREDAYIKDNVILNFTDIFYDKLNSFFLEKGLEIHYNNTRSTFWCFGDD